MTGSGILTRLTGRYAVLIVGLWVLAAAAANLAVPQLERVVDSHARSFMPTDAPSAVAASRAAQLFDQTPSNNFVYVVLERDQKLTPRDRQFYDAMTTALGSDRRHVYAVTDLWSQPATAAGAQSSDGRAVSVMVRLAGMLGTAQARDSVNAVRATVQKLSPPAGLEVHVTGPGATIVDEFSAIDRQMLSNHRRHHRSHPAVAAGGVPIADCGRDSADLGRARPRAGPRGRRRAGTVQCG